MPAARGERAAGEGDPVRVVHEPVEDGIAKRGVPDAGVPVFDGQLTGDQGGAASDPILDQLEQIPPFAVAEWGQAPVVEDEQIGLREGLHQLPVGAVRHGRARALR